MPITGTVNGRFHQLLLSKATSQLSIKFSDSFLMFYCGRVAFTVFKHADIKGVRLRLTSTASLCWLCWWVLWGDKSRRQGAPRDVTIGGVRETALASIIYAPFTWRLLTFMGWNWKCHVIIVIKTDLLGFVVPMHSGLYKQYVKALGIWLPVSHAPLCIGTTNLSRTGLNPLANTLMSKCTQACANSMTNPFG